MADHRPVEHGLIQNSNVLVLTGSHRPLIAPPSPPTPSESPPVSFCEPIDSLDIDDAPLNGGLAKTRRLLDGIHVLATQAEALRCLAALYEADPVAQDGFSRSVEVIVSQRYLNAKLVISGVGKSGYIGRKLVATFQSLGIPAAFLHPTEALHGDLGFVGQRDTFMFITSSGKTSELLLLLPHLPESTRIIVLTSHTSHEACELLRRRPDGILLSAPVHMAETESFGVPAPTTSTTAALALGDALALAAARELHPDMTAVFARNHPGGAIGAALRSRGTVKDLLTPWDCIPTVGDGALGADLLRAGFGSSVGWVRVGGGAAPPSKIKGLSSAELGRPAHDIADLIVSTRSMVCVSPETSKLEAEAIVRDIWAAGGNAGVVLAVMHDADIMGVLEASQVMPEDCQR